MKAKDLRERSNDDLKELEKSLAKDTFTARFKNFTNRLDDTSTINKTKRDLARVKTLLRQAELNAGPAPKAEVKAAAPKAPKALRAPKALKAKTAKTSTTKKTAAKKASKSEAK
jgi:large subunit ribosomal protein L29